VRQVLSEPAFVNSQSGQNGRAANPDQHRISESTDKARAERQIDESARQQQQRRAYAQQLTHEQNGLHSALHVTPPVGFYIQAAERTDIAARRLPRRNSTHPDLETPIPATRLLLVQIFAAMTNATKT
jgi:hypothetical protein